MINKLNIRVTVVIVSGIIPLVDTNPHRLLQSPNDLGWRRQPAYNIEYELQIIMLFFFLFLCLFEETCYFLCSLADESIILDVYGVHAPHISQSSSRTLRGHKTCEGFTSHDAAPMLHVLTQIGLAEAQYKESQLNIC